MSASQRIRNAIVICAAVASSSSSSPSILLVAAASPSSPSSSSSVAAATIATTSNKRRAVHPSPSASTLSWGCRVPRGGSANDDKDDEIEVDSESSSSAVVTTAASGTKTKQKRKKSKSLKKKKSAGDNDTPIIESVTNQDEGEEDDDDDVTTDKSSTAKKNTISEVMKGKDAASILGDGIRQRANLLRRDVLPTYYSYEERALDAALTSVGLSLGTAGTDRDKNIIRKEEEEEDENLAYYQYGHRIDNSQEEGRKNRPPSLSSTTLTTALSDYFLKTHGGTHIVQILLSLLASGLGVTCLILPPFPTSTSYLAGTAAAAGTTTTTTSTKSSSKLLSQQIILSTLKYQLLQQTLILGMAKHASGLIGAILLGALQIPNLGVRNVRRHLERVASHDPVGRYLFYCSLLVVWMGWFTGGGSGFATVGGGGMSGYIARMRGSVLSIMNAASATAAASAASASSIPSFEGGGDSSSSSVISQEAAVTTQLLNTLMEQPPPWFLSHSWMGYILPFFILGPVLLREIISVIWVISDVLSLIVLSSKSKSTKLLLGTFSSSCRTIVDGFLRVLLVASDEEWKSADSFQRQVILAGLVSRCSSVMELAVSGILFWDAIQSFWNFAFSSPTATTTTVSVARLPFKCVLGKMACAHLYLNYLQSKKKKMKAKTSTKDKSVFEQDVE